MGQGYPTQMPPGWRGVVKFPFSPGALLTHRAPMPMLVKVPFPPEGGALPSPHLTCHSSRWPQSCWKWYRSRLRPCWGCGIWLRSMSPEGKKRPSSLPGQCPIIYPKTLQQLLPGPEPDFSGSPCVGPGYGKKKKKKVLSAYRPLA